MYRMAMLMMMLFIAGTASFAQIRPTPRVIKRVTDEGMVIDDRGSKLEIFPALRVVKTVSMSGKENICFNVMANKSDPINPEQLGVVFNSAMQVWGYITGEIALKMKDGMQASDWLDPSSYPKLAKLTEPNVYLVVARTPVEFVKLIKQLQARTDTDMEWVEPIVLYGLGPVPDAGRP